MSNLVYVDIETDGLDATVIWCAVCRHNGVSEVICNEQDFKAYVSNRKDCKFVFHNGIGFDVPVVRRLWNFDFPRDMVCLLYTSPSPRDKRQSRMPSSA